MNNSGHFVNESNVASCTNRKNSVDECIYQVKKLQSQHLQAKLRLAKVKKATENISAFKAEIVSLTTKILARQAFYTYAETCAITIQKVVRGYLVRNKNDEEIIKIRKKKVNSSLAEVLRSDNTNLFNTGRTPIWAAIKINRFLKRMCFLIKIRRITQTYLHLKMLKEAESMIGIKKGLQVIFNLNLVKTKKFERYRKFRLEEIKRNLAVLKVKRYYQANRLTFRQLMRRFKKYKRMIKMCKSGSVKHDKTNDGLSTRDHTSTRSDIFSEASNERIKNNDNMGNILECASFTSTEYLHIENERKERIHNGMISYNIQKQKEPVAILPYLYQKDLLEELEGIKNYKVLTNVLAKRISLANPLRQSPTKLKEKLPIINSVSPKKVELRKLIFDKEHLPNFTRPTFTSSFVQSIDESPKVTSRGNRENTTLFNQTFSTIQKTTMSTRSSSRGRKIVSHEKRKATASCARRETQKNIVINRAQTTLDKKRIEGEIEVKS